MLGHSDVELAHTCFHPGGKTFQCFWPVFDRSNRMASMLTLCRERKDLVLLATVPVNSNSFAIELISQIINL